MSKYDYFYIGKERLDTFSDAVIAISITLLVLEMKVPNIKTDTGNLILKLIQQWPIYASTIVSFFIIGCMWLNHHRLSNSIKKINHGYILLTLLWLFSICLIPYSTNLVGEYLLDGKLIYVVTPIYIGVLLFVVVTWMFIRVYAIKNKLFIDGYSPEIFATLGIKIDNIILIIWILIFIIAFFYPYISIIGVLIITTFYCFPRGRIDSDVDSCNKTK